jgi:hypothetical protein
MVTAAVTGVVMATVTGVVTAAVTSHLSSERSMAALASLEPLRIASRSFSLPALSLYLSLYLSLSLSLSIYLSISFSLFHSPPLVGM